jgi:hypothetical protein
MKPDAVQFREFLSRLEERRRFVEVDAATPDSRAYVDGHYEKALSCLLHAEHISASVPAAVVPLCYQVVLSAALLALRREGIAVEPHRGQVDTDTIRAGVRLLRFDAAHSESVEQLLQVYARGLDVGPLPTGEEAESALRSARHAVQGLADKQPRTRG